MFVESTETVLFENVRELLTPAEIPKEIISMPNFTKTSSAKIDTAKTVALYLNSL